MKIFTLQKLGLLSLFVLLGCLVTYAQENHPEKIVLVQKITHEDGSRTIVKKRMPEGDELKNYLKELKLADAQNVEIHVVQENGNKLFVDVEKLKEGEEDIFTTCTSKRERVRREWREEGAKMRRIMRAKREQWQDAHYSGWENNRKKRPILGVYLNNHHDEEGLELSGLVRGAGAEVAGLQKGDVLLSVNGTKLTRVSDLRTELARFEVGDEVVIQYLRDGRLVDTEIQLAASRSWSNWSYRRDPCKVFIGITSTNYRDYGIRGRTITRVIPGTSAEAAELQEGDIITALDGVPVGTHNEIVYERDKHDPGDWYTLTLIRDGETIDVEAQFKSCDKEDEKEEIIEEVVVEEEVVDEELPATIKIDRELKLEAWNAFPNPTFGQLNVRFQGEAVPTSFRIIDAVGKVIYQEDMPQFDGFYNKELSFPDATPGSIFLQVQQGERAVVKKVVLLNRA